MENYALIESGIVFGLKDRSAFERASVEAKKNNTRTVKKLAMEFIKVISGIHINEK